MAATPEQSEHTSIRKRIYDSSNSNGLEDFVSIDQTSIGIPYKLKNYIELVDWTGRIIRDDKFGHIDNSLPMILDRLRLNSDSWISLATEFENHFQSWVSSERIVKALNKSERNMRSPSVAYPLE